MGVSDPQPETGVTGVVLDRNIIPLGDGKLEVVNCTVGPNGTIQSKLANPRFVVVGYGAKLNVAAGDPVVNPYAFISSSNSKVVQFSASMAPAADFEVGVYIWGT